MKKLFGLIFNRWVLIAVLLIAAAVVIWTVGPLVAIAGREPLATESSRWIAIGVLVGLVALLVAWGAWRARRGNSAVVNQLMAAPGASGKEAESPDLAAVRERFERALTTLRRARFGSGGLLSGWAARLGGRYLYELPWYLFIGAPGSGKTTALLNCGLKFPLADKFGDHAVRGVGGTRNCDWWFTDQAVLIDTAGRFTTQDSDRETDRGTWGGFLKMLAKVRPRQPVNGVLVTVSVPDLLTRSAEERAQHAATVRARLQELQQDLGIRFPIYLMVTKCDLLAGFMDTFATLDKEQRASPWGFTFPLGDKSAPDLALLSNEFGLLQKRLTDGLIDRLQAEADPQRRAAIYGFPSQFAGLHPLLQEFADAAFSPSPFDAHPLLRGVYFISGTQEGTPIDRMLGSIARSYRLERAMLAPNQASGKSYFLSRLISEVVFAESGVAGTNLKWERRRSQLAVGAYALIALVTIGTIAAWSISYANNRKYVADVAERADAVRQLLNTTPNRNSPDLLPILPALEATQQLARPEEATPRSLGYGLFQGAKLNSAAHAAYGRMLVDAVQPRLALRVEEQLRQGGDAAESQYEALKAYLMLHDATHVDQAALKGHIERDWDVQLARELTTEQRDRLSAHLDALLAQGAVVSPVPGDPALVATTRAQLASVALPQRIYNRMRTKGLSGDYPEFSVTRAAGSNAALVFARSSGRPLTKGVPGMFTYDGYHKGFQSEVGRIADELSAEQGWVLGVDGAARGGSLLGNAELTDAVRRIYLTEYASTWDAYIADIRVVPLTSLPLSVQTARLLSAPDSPLPVLMKALARETTLSAAIGTKSAIDKAKDSAVDAFNAGSAKLKGMVSPRQPPASSESLEITLVDDRFKALRQFAIAPEGGKARVDDTVAMLGELAVLLQAVETALKGGVAPPPSPLPNKIKAEAALAPQPVRAMLETLSDSSERSSKVMMRDSLSKMVKAEVGEFCNQAIARRYPIDPRATLDATQADFAQLFGPGGKIDKLIQGPLAPYVDTTARPSWRFRPVEGTALGSDVGALPQFQRAAVIRDTFFPGGAAAPSLRLSFTPVEMDAAITTFVLDIDGQVVRYGHGPQIPTPVQWPGPRGSSQVRVQVSAQNSSGSGGMVTDGPWALLRMLDRARIDPGVSPERFRVTFDVDGRKAVFDVTTSSVRNPFKLRELTEFSCPQGL